MYIEQAEYIAKGGTITDSTTFWKLEYKAEKEIDQRTFNRLKNQAIPDEVKYLMVELIDYMYSSGDYDGRVSSFNNDGLSITYDTNKSKNEPITELIDTYLANVVVNDKKLLYRGVYADESK